MAYWVKTKDGETKYVPGKDLNEEGGMIKIGDSVFNESEIERIEETLCFVATAVYGDIDAPEVKLLRDFRDNILRDSVYGRKFIDFYYSGSGEKTARFIEKNLPTLGVPVIKKGLDVLVALYSRHKSK